VATLIVFLKRSDIFRSKAFLYKIYEDLNIHHIT